MAEVGTGRSPKGLVTVNAIRKERIPVPFSVDIRHYKMKIQKALGRAAVGDEFKQLPIQVLLMSIKQHFKIRYECSLLPI